MSRLSEEKVAGSGKEVRFDSAISVTFSSVTAAVESINDKIKNIEEELEKVKISSSSSDKEEGQNGVEKGGEEATRSQLARLTFFQ